MKISKKFELRLLLIFLLFTFLCFLFLLINTYGMNHFLDDKNNLLEENFDKAVPNIYDCNFNYYEINHHMKEGGFTKLRFRKSVTGNELCFGKITYTGITPGTKFSDISRDSYIEFGVNQKHGLPLWLYEVNFLMFTFIIFMLIIFQIFFYKKNFFVAFIFTILIYSIITFNENNTFINSSKSYFPNTDTTNENFMQNRLNDDS